MSSHLIFGVILKANYDQEFSKKKMLLDFFVLISCTGYDETSFNSLRLYGFELFLSGQELRQIMIKPNFFVVVKVIKSSIHIYFTSFKEIKGSTQ